MRRVLALFTLLLLSGPVRGQGQPPGPAGAKAGAPPPAAPATPGKAAPNAPVNPPAAGSPAAPAAGKKVTVRVPSGGSYTAYIHESPSTLATIQDRGELEVPAGLKAATVYVLDSKSGYAGRKAINPAAPGELTFDSRDFKLVQRVRVQATGKDDRPIAQGIVTLTDSGKNTARKLIQPASQGVAEFEFVVGGSGTVTVVPEGGSATSKEITLAVPPGETAQTIAVGLPEVTATVEPAGGAAEEKEAAPESPSAAGPAPAAQSLPAAPSALPPPDTGGGWGSTLVGFIFLIALLGGGYLFLKNRGITLDTVRRKLGVQPDAVAVGGGSLAGANVATSAPAPASAPAPPPVVSDPNQCQFCGQMKDAAGNCACTVAPGASSAYAAPAPFGAGPATSGGSRLVGAAGTYMGEVFPVNGTVVIGRDPGNPVPLDRDTTTSRRHAQITAEGGAFRIQDLGSSNGTYVNGTRITETVLQPGDEVSIGGTRFRFEV